jgi:hypothetical protein
MDEEDLVNTTLEDSKVDTTVEDIVTLDIEVEARTEDADTTKGMDIKDRLDTRAVIRMDMPDVGTEAVDRDIPLARLCHRHRCHQKHRLLYP